jgi:hypothetical protein
MRDGRELLQGAIGLHVHSNPDLVIRPQEEYDLVVAAREAGYRGVLLKNAAHFNIGSISILRRLFPDLEIHSGLVLNHWVGGLNPSAVEAAVTLGARVTLPAQRAGLRQPSLKRAPADWLPALRCGV